MHSHAHCNIIHNSWSMDTPKFPSAGDKRYLYIYVYVYISIYIYICICIGFLIWLHIPWIMASVGQSLASSWSGCYGSAGPRAGPRGSSYPAELFLYTWSLFKRLRLEKKKEKKRKKEAHARAYFFILGFCNSLFSCILLCVLKRSSLWFIYWTLPHTVFDARNKCNIRDP